MRACWLNLDTISLGLQRPSSGEQLPRLTGRHGRSMARMLRPGNWSGSSSASSSSEVASAWRRPGICPKPQLAGLATSSAFDAQNKPPADEAPKDRACAPSERRLLLVSPRACACACACAYIVYACPYANKPRHPQHHRRPSPCRSLGISARPRGRRAPCSARPLVHQAVSSPTRRTRTRPRPRPSSRLRRACSEAPRPIPNRMRTPEVCLAAWASRSKTCNNNSSNSRIWAPRSWAVSCALHLPSNPVKCNNYSNNNKPFLNSGNPSMTSSQIPTWTAQVRAQQHRPEFY